VPWQPAEALAYAAVFLQGRQEFVAQKRVVGAGHAVPRVAADLIDGSEYFKLHEGSLPKLGDKQIFVLESRCFVLQCRAWTILT
jgi:hypothetical protein